MSAVRLSDSEIAMVSMTANMGEVQQNMVGIMRAQREDARNFAQEMVDVHTAALDRQTALASSMNITPAESATSRMLKSTSDEMVAMLQSASDDEFDNVYVQSQIDAHQMVLSLIESTLLPSVRAPQLRDELTMMQDTVMMHLEHARQLGDED